MDKNKKSGPKRLIMNIKESDHRKIKMASTYRNMSITQYVLEAVAWRLRNEKFFDENSISS